MRIKTKKSPHAGLAAEHEGNEAKTGLLYIFPARRGTTHGPFSYEIIAGREGFINE